MLLNEKAREWQSNLLPRFSSMFPPSARVVLLREITSGFLVLRLLFCEESCEGDDVCVDLLLPDWAFVAVLSHVERDLDLVTRGRCVSVSGGL